MKFTKILDGNWVERIRNGDTVQVAGKDGSQFKTHVQIIHGVPIFKDGKGKILTAWKVAEVVLLYEKY